MIVSIIERLQRRLRWYRSRFQVNNPVVGMAVELLGDKVRMDGLTYSVAAPQIGRGHKSTLAFGLHEMEERELIRRWLPSHLPVVEFGGGLGVVSCLINRRLEHPEKHIVVEANPAMIPILEKNRDLNRCKFRIVNRAVAYDCDYVDLNIAADFVGSSVKQALLETTVKVAATTVADVLTEAGFGEVGIVCDIEGVEANIIERELAHLGDRIRFFMAEMHPKLLGDAVVTSSLDRLRAMGFGLDQQIGDSVFFSR